MFKRKPNLEDTLNILRNYIEKFQKNSDYRQFQALKFRNIAKDYLKAGNRSAARNAMRRFLYYNRFSQRYINYAENLEQRMMIIEQAQSLKELQDAFKQAGAILTKAFMDSNSILEMIVKQEDQMREIEKASEMLAAAPEDVDEDIQEELNKLEKEIFLEEEIELEVPTHPPVAEEEKEKLPAEKKKEAA